ncbi:MAG: NAD(P)-binding domain-containing protein [FCB group bacterium]|nr:NAD(P)-binding domain-containing protein [FCB group bacterium]
MSSENLLTTVIGLLILVAFLIPYIVSMRKKERRTRERLKESQSKGQAKALLQHPIINQSVCIGCGICVSSCPEGDVLGLINGKATIIHGSHCVGHGLCAENCPIGAIQVGLGDISEREDIPRLNERFETNITGIYIIGELSGMALIRNAINHGTIAMNAISESLKEMPGLDTSVAIIGAGPSGLAAALRAKELGIDFKILDQDKPGGTILQYPRKKLTLVQRVTIPLYGDLTKGEYTKEELLTIWETVIRDQSIHLETGYKLLGVDRREKGFLVKTSQGELTAQKVVLALGRRGTPRKLNVPGENQGKVMYKLLDAETYKNTRILVVGGGDSAIEAAIGLASQVGNQVTISYRKENFFRLKARNETNIERFIREKKLDVIFSSTVREIGQEEVILGKGDETRIVPNDYVFIFAGGELPFPLLDSIGIDFGKKIRPKT